MNKRIKALAEQASLALFDDTAAYRRLPGFAEKFAELIVKACADAADMAVESDTAYHGDYVAEQMGYGAEDGITDWRNM